MNPYYQSLVAFLAAAALAIRVFHYLKGTDLPVHTSCLQAAARAGRGAGLPPDACRRLGFPGANPGKYTRTGQRRLRPWAGI